MPFSKWTEYLCFWFSGFQVCSCFQKLVWVISPPNWETRKKEKKRGGGGWCWGRLDSNLYGVWTGSWRGASSPPEHCRGALWAGHWMPNCSKHLIWTIPCVQALFSVLIQASVCRRFNNRVEKSTDFFKKGVNKVHLLLLSVSVPGHSITSCDPQVRQTSTDIQNVFVPFRVKWSDEVFTWLLYTYIFLNGRVIPPW